MPFRFHLTLHALTFSAVFLTAGIVPGSWAMSAEDAYHEKAKALFARSNEIDDGCLALIDKAIAINPKRREFYYTKAIFLWSLQEDDNLGLSCLEKSEALGSNGSYLYFLRGQFLRRLGRKREALASAEKSFSMAREPNCAHFCSLLNEQLGNYKKAREWVDTALKLNPGGIDYYDSRAGLRYKMGDYKGAIEDADMTLKLSKVSLIQTVRRAWRLKADAYTMLKEPAKAEKSLQELLRVYPNDRVTLQLMAKHYKETGNKTKEAQILEQIKKLDLDY